jgi:hypothetical protein
MAAIKEDWYVREWALIRAHHHSELISAHSTLDEASENAE